MTVVNKGYSAFIGSARLRSVSPTVVGRRNHPIQSRIVALAGAAFSTFIVVLYPTRGHAQNLSPQVNEGSDSATGTNEFPLLNLPSDLFSFHAQTTLVYQGNAGFRAPYSGTNSLNNTANARETWDLTLYGGLHPWAGGEFWADGEVDQGFGISNTVGLAGFSSGEAYKRGALLPYFRLQRAFFRQTFNIGGEQSPTDADQNQFALSKAKNRFVLTIGKISIPDIFDTNPYAANSRTDFLNWTVITNGTFDYAADAWGYTAGSAGELYLGRWVFRSGFFLMSNVPNSVDLDTSFGQFQLLDEIEEDHTISGQPGSIKLTGFLTRANMARFSDALRLSAETNTTPSLAAVRNYATRPGIGINIAQQLHDGVGAFFRAGIANGHYESYEFSDIDRSVSGGISLSGSLWQRPNDALGFAGAINEASRARRAFLNAGGMGLLSGDGKLPNSGDEKIIETYYSFSPIKIAQISVDYQFVKNPAYNRDRGPVSIFAVRLHAQI